MSTSRIAQEVTSPADRHETEEICLAVPTRDRHKILERCLLPSLLSIAEAGFDVLVVDQSSGDATERLLADAAGIRYVRDAPLGISHARNVAVDRTSSPLLAFTDDDVVLPPSWLEGVVRGFEREDAGAVCGRARTPGGRLLPGVHRGVYRWPTIPFGLGSGFNLAFRRSSLEQAGPFDEELGTGARFRSAEDSDMLYRIMRSGWTVVCSDEITVVHHDHRRGLDELRLHFGYGLGAGAQTAGHAAAGDRVAVRIAVRELGRHARTLARALATLRLKLAALQVLFVGGLATGYARRRRFLRQAAQPTIRS